MALALLSLGGRLMAMRLDGNGKLSFLTRVHRAHSSRLGAHPLYGLDNDPTGNGYYVPLSEVSELMRFEGPDPAYWVCHGYAVLEPDPRGVGLSEGNIAYWGAKTG